MVIVIILCPFPIFQYRVVQALSSHKSNASINSYWKGIEKRTENNAVFPTSLFMLSSFLISFGSLFLALCLFSHLSINISWHLCCTITSTKENFLAFISFIETNLSFENIIANVWNNSWEFPQSCLYLKYFSETYVHVYLSICHIFLYRKLWINIYVNISCKKINYFSVLQICLEKIFSLPFEHVNYWQMDDKIYLFDLCRLRYFYWCAIYTPISLNLD